MSLLARFARSLITHTNYTHLTSPSCMSTFSVSGHYLILWFKQNAISSSTVLDEIIFHVLHRFVENSADEWKKKIQNPVMTKKRDKILKKVGSNSRPLIRSLLQDSDNPPQLDNTEGIM